jgi:hypothetical protein
MFHQPEPKNIDEKQDIIDDAMGKTKHLPYHRITIEPAANGHVVRHTPFKKGGKGEPDYGNETTKVFNHANQAGAHVLALMGAKSDTGQD